MKKFFVFGLGVLFALQTSVVSALSVPATSVSTASGATPSTTMEPAISGLLAFNHWLYANNFYGISYINDSLAEAYKEAFQWDAHPMLMYVSFLYPDKSCLFEFSAQDKPNEIFTSNCVDLKTSKLQTQTLPATEASSEGSFDFPVMKLRKFVSDILGSPDVLNKIRTTMQGSSRSDLYFTLQKVDGEVRWYWSLVDTGKQFGLDIYANAQNLSSPLQVKNIAS